jgi:hypothetical protein
VPQDILPELSACLSHAPQPKSPIAWNQFRNTQTLLAHEGQASKGREQMAESFEILIRDLLKGNGFARILRKGSNQFFKVVEFRSGTEWFALEFVGFGKNRFDKLASVSNGIE